MVEQGPRGMVRHDGYGLCVAKADGDVFKQAVDKRIGRPHFDIGQGGRKHDARQYGGAGARRDGRFGHKDRARSGGALEELAGEFDHPRVRYGVQIVAQLLAVAFEHCLRLRHVAFGGEGEDQGLVGRFAIGIEFEDPVGQLPHQLRFARQPFRLHQRSHGIRQSRQDALPFGIQPKVRTLGGCLDAGKEDAGDDRQNIFDHVRGRVGGKRSYQQEIRNDDVPSQDHVIADDVDDCRAQLALTDPDARE
ncbi:MAG: hypothetical protein QM805_11625 [Pseudomonas sp.]